MRRLSSGEKEPFPRGLVVQGPLPAKLPAAEGIRKKEMAAIICRFSRQEVESVFPPLEFGLAL